MKTNIIHCIISIVSVFFFFNYLDYVLVKMAEIRKYKFKRKLLVFFIIKTNELKRERNIKI
jgi:hypothetical protein